MGVSMHIVRIKPKQADGFVLHLPCSVPWPGGSGFYRAFSEAMKTIETDGFIDGPDDVQYLTDSYERPVDFEAARRLVMENARPDYQAELLKSLFIMENDIDLYFSTSF